MKATCWILFSLSVLLFVLGFVSRYAGPWDSLGQVPGTYWRGAMGLVIYAIALKILGANKGTPA